MSLFLSCVRLFDFSLLTIIYVRRYVKVRLYLRWLHYLILLILINTLIFKFLLNSSVGLILIHIFINLIIVGQILIDFINLLILILYVWIWILRLSNLCLLLLNSKQLLQLGHELRELNFSILQFSNKIEADLALEKVISQVLIVQELLIARWLMWHRINCLYCLTNLFSLKCVVIFAKGCLVQRLWLLHVVCLILHHLGWSLIQFGGNGLFFLHVGGIEH